MNSVIPKYCVSQDPKMKCMQEKLSFYNYECSQELILKDEIKIDLEYLQNFSFIKLVYSEKEAAYTFQDENGSVILSGKSNPLDNTFTILSKEEKILFRIESTDDHLKNVGEPTKRCKILSSSNLLSYITIHPPMMSLIKFDIRDTNNKVYLTVESDNFFSPEYLVKASNGIKTIAKLKGSMGCLELTFLDPENLNLISKVSLVSLLMVMKCTSQLSNGNILKLSKDVSSS